ncbi:MAG: c-type cytochrome [Flavobacteriales bacterium]
MKKIIFVGIVISSCVYNKQEPLPLPKIEESTNDSIEVVSITYTNYVKKVMDDNCAACHSASGVGISPFLTNYNEVKQQGLNGRIKARAIDENPTRMPIAASLSKPIKDTLQMWLNGGMPE